MHALRGKEHIEYDNPYDVGMTGLLGFASGYKAIKEADVLLMLGTDFPYTQFYPDNARIIQVDIRGATSGPTHVRSTSGWSAPSRTPSTRCSRCCTHKRTATILTARSTTTAHPQVAGLTLAVNDRNRTPIRPEYVAGRRIGSPPTTRCSPFDVGSPVVWAARYLTMNGRRRLIGSFNHGTMACALPYAIGAQTADRDVRSSRLPATAALTMLFGELITLVQNEPPGQGRGVQQLFAELRRAGNEGRRHRELRHRPAKPKLRRRRASRSGSSVAVSNNPKTSSCARRRVRPRRTRLVDVVTARQELSIPPRSPPSKQRDSPCTQFGRSLPGAGDELLDLVTTNVARRILD